MGKHSSAEDKQNIVSSTSGQKLPAQKLHRRGSVGMAGPPSGTNSKNQFR